MENIYKRHQSQLNFRIFIQFFFIYLLLPAALFYIPTIFINGFDSISTFPVELLFFPLVILFRRNAATIGLFFVIFSLQLFVEVLKVYGVSTIHLINMISTMDFKLLLPIIRENIKSFGLIMATPFLFSTLYGYIIIRFDLKKVSKIVVFLTVLLNLTLVTIYDRFMPEINYYLIVQKPYINLIKEFTQKIFDIYPEAIVLDNDYNRVPLDFDQIIEDKQSVFFIIVESLGVFKKEENNIAQVKHLLTSSIKDKYKIYSGELEHNAKTIGGEIRELCKVNLSEPPAYKMAFMKDCLPHKFEENGYNLQSYHGFTKFFYSRNIIYPAIGLKNTLFQEDFMKNEKQLTQFNSTFGGIFDNDILDYIFKNDLSSNHNGPNFTYFLTLNAHLPTNLYAKNYNQRNCSKWNKIENNDDKEKICKFQSYHDVLFERLESHLNKSSPNEIIIIVGDHNPRWHIQSVKRHYNLLKVPYIVLIPKKTKQSYIIN